MKARVEIPTRATVEMIMARKTMSALYPCNSRILVTDIIDVVAYEMGISRNDLTSGDRSADLFRARAAVIWLARRLTCTSYPQLGAMLPYNDQLRDVLLRQLYVRNALVRTYFDAVSGAQAGN